MASDGLKDWGFLKWTFRREGVITPGGVLHWKKAEQVET